MIFSFKQMLKTPSKALGKHSIRSFSVFTNETLKKAFDSKVKERYMYTQRDKEVPDQESDKFEDVIKESANQFFSEMEQEESVLEAYKKQVNTEGYDEFTIQDQQRITETVDFLKKTETHFSNITEDEFMKRSQNLYDSMRLRTSWNPVPNEKISDEYLNYDKFNKNQTKIKDKQPNILDDGEYVLSRDLKKLWKNLDDEDLADTKRWKIAVDNIKETARSPEEAEEKIEKMDESLERDVRQFMAGTDANRRKDMNWGQIDPKKYRDNEYNGRLSPFAKESIYQLYLEGWTVRDLSIRFGILPERVKAVVWMKSLFYDEIMPRVSLETVKLGLEKEMLYRRDHMWVDYGLDLGMMAMRERGMPFQRFRIKDVDIKPPKEVKEKMEKILSTKGKKKYDIVTEKFVGEGPKGYFIKSWIVYKRHGSERVNKRFKDILKFEKSPHKLPYPVQKKLHKGPRIASKGYGIH